jgi:hypothetical protein
MKCRHRGRSVIDRARRVAVRRQATGNPGRLRLRLGRERADSDVDVAVLIDRRVPPGRISKYRLKLMADLGAALRRSDVDAVILNEASPLLAHRVLSQGTLVFERSAPARVRFQTKTASLYLDLIPIFETHIRYLKRNVREGRIVG